jgi:hypothetical protein
MKIKQTIISFALLLGVATVAVQSPVMADCAGAKTSIINCDSVGNTSAKDSGVWKLLLLALNIMTAGVGVLAVGGIAYGAALYASAGDKPEQTKKAMEIIKNVVIGIVAYGLMFVVLNFLIPGGVFKVSASTGTSVSEIAKVN